jgi:hypothetical protein
MLGFVAGHQPPPESYSMFSMVDGLDAIKHAGGGSLSGGTWNKCGNLVYSSLFNVHYFLLLPFRSFS